MELFLWLAFIAFVIIIIQNDLPQRILLLCLTVKLKCLCSEPCLPVDGRKEENNTSPAWGLPKGSKELVLKIGDECSDPRMKKQIKPRGVLECKNGKIRPCPSFPPHVVTINRFQVLLSSITCLPSYPIGRRYLPYSSHTQYTCLTQSANDPQATYPTPCTLGIKVD